MIDQLFAYSGDLQAASPMARRTKPRRGRLAPWRLSRFSAPCRGRAQLARGSWHGDESSGERLGESGIRSSRGGHHFVRRERWRNRDRNRHLCRPVPAAGTVKPVSAFIDDIGASAAYWVASQAGRLFIAPTAAVGGIGTYGVVTDMSGLANAIGFKVHVVRRWSLQRHGDPRHGDHGGTTGGNATRGQWAQDAHFLAGVASGRRMTPARAAELADGRVHIAGVPKPCGSAWPTA